MSEPVVLTIPDMQQVRVRKDVTYKTVQEDTPRALQADIYYPPDFQPEERRAAVVFVHGNAQGSPKEWGQYLSWGRLVAMSGLIGVTFDHRASVDFSAESAGAADVDDLIAFVRAHAAWGIDPDRLGIWACSAGVPRGVRAAMRGAPTYVRAIVLYYGWLDLGDDPADQESSAMTYVTAEAPRIAPVFIAKAQHDRPDINTSIDRFVAAAAERKLSVELMVHEQGQHGFDVRDDDDRSRAIIRRTLAFLQAHLGAG
jgi:acetyl esterase/lipase